ncbi:GNAT family N-acetyltransferase [Paeniglutamicibacter psychrophenolicus]|uniref:GNAT family N-acetyltransferase n=1 Tax=Paeniglutamicibacter psychrophenolicus TaxID=257454 RepID=UPI002788862F|nr:GNAT family N-acetyltransferase [Paeniglutamicibacter psychrophenolicus]MDQ0095569.1 siderophore synthetase component [Paeniglutamicibacter psychrophenolicus]
MIFTPAIVLPPARRTAPAAADFTFRRFDPGTDAGLLHGWVNTERARYWDMIGTTVPEVRAAYGQLDASAHHHVLLGLLPAPRGAADPEPMFLLEHYAPEHSALAGRYAHRHGDTGMHLLLAGPGDGRALPGFSAAAMEAALAHLFADPAVLRIVVEPDAANTAIHSLNSRLGFRPAGRIELPAGDDTPAKTALLSICTRADFAAATGRPASAAVHLSPGRWENANRHLLAKAIAEFTHERLLAPVPVEGGWSVGTGTHEYRFSATVHALEHWVIDPDSLEATVNGEAAAPDAAGFVLAFRDTLGMPDAQLPVYLEEITSTLAGHCYKQLHSTASAAELAAGTGDAVADFQRTEAAMTEGHPCFVANNGHLGLGATDYLDHAPETGAALALQWLAAHGSRARYSTLPGLDIETLLQGELGPRQLACFRARIAEACASSGLDPEDFVLIPVHPWQWEHKLSVGFAGDVASGHLVHLGAGADLYQPQQSIRTFFNRSAPTRHYVKTALSVLNMGFMRGLSAAYMEGTPAINAWLTSIFEDDEELQRSNVGLLREIAAVGYANPLYEAAGPDAPQRKMLAALWRESPAGSIAPGQQLATMASLLHVDSAGASLAAAHIRRSGLAATDWLARYFDAYLVPLVHVLCRYDLAFMPHGENVILVLQDSVPVKVLHKDLAEEIAVLGDRLALPPEVERIRAAVPDAERRLVVFTDIVDCFLRFLAPLLAREGICSEEEFWETAADRLLAYRNRNPETAAVFDALDLFAEDFELSCLNRLQLRNNRQMLDLTDQSGGLIHAGILANPLAGHGI